MSLAAYIRNSQTKRFCLWLGIACMALGTTSGMAQKKEHATWKIGSARINDGEAIITFQVTLDSGWHLYSQHVQVSQVALKFTFNESGHYSMVESVREESQSIYRFDPFFNKSVARYERYASFSQRIKLSQPNAIASGTLHFTIGYDGLRPVKEVLHFSVAVSVKSAKEKVAVN